MKLPRQTLTPANRWLLVLAGTLMTCALRTALADNLPAHAGLAAVTVQGGGGAVIAGGGPGSNQGTVIIKTIEPVTGEEQAARSDQAWLGVAIDEVSEVLASQLGLAPGVGLVVTYVTPESPAAKAGVQKNDVLVALDGQQLVLPAQLRKLVHVRKTGDTIELTFYRAGKKQTVSATLAKAPPRVAALEDGQPWMGPLYGLSYPFRNLPIGDAIRDQLKAYRDSLGHFKIDEKKLQEEYRHSMEQARKAVEDAVRYSTNAASAALTEALKELQHSGIIADNNASVTVRSSGEKVQSIVKSDESGTIVIVSNPKPRLTAHDKDGKLIFDGEIDTPEQRAKVPADLWERVEPLLDKLAPAVEEEPAPKPAPSKGKSSRHEAPRTPAPASAEPTL
jgi:hypothetical protein